MRFSSFSLSRGVISELVTSDGLLLIALDGTWFFSSEQITCPSCQSKRHKNGTTTYHHSAITPVIVKPRVDQAVLLPPEFITADDGSSKQDYENKAAKRWMQSVDLRYLSERYTVLLLGDDLYAQQPVCEHTVRHGYSFIYVCKTPSHQYLYEWFSEFSSKELHQKTYRHWTGKKHQLYRYRYRNGVPVRDGADALWVNSIRLE